MTDDQKARANALTSADLATIRDASGHIPLGAGRSVTDEAAWLRSLREGTAAAHDAEAFFALLSPRPADSDPE